MNEKNEQGKQVKEVTYKELNFEYNVVGSDETGKSETFKEIIVVAAYVRPGKEHMDALLKLNVNDSKKMVNKDSKDPQNRLNEVGEELSNIGENSPTIKSYSDLKKKLKTGDGVWVETTDHLIYCVTVYSNEKYNGEKKSKDVNTQLTDLHLKVIQELLKHIEIDDKTYIVVDDFFSESGEGNKKRSEEGNRKRLVGELNDSGCSQIVSVTKADANVIAVSCASVISAYLQNLHLKEIAKADDRNLDYNDIFAGTISADIYEKVKEGKFSLEEQKALSEKPWKNERAAYYKSIEDFMKKLQEKGNNVLAKFFDDYAKKPKKNSKGEK